MNFLADQTQLIYRFLMTRQPSDEQVIARKKKKGEKGKKNIFLIGYVTPKNQSYIMTPIKYCKYSFKGCNDNNNHH